MSGFTEPPELQAIEEAVAAGICEVWGSTRFAQSVQEPAWMGAEQAWQRDADAAQDALLRVQGLISELMTLGSLGGHAHELLDVADTLDLICDERRIRPL